MLATAEVPVAGTVTVNRAGVCFVARIESEKDIDNYLAEVREKLIEKLSGHDVTHLIKKTKLIERMFVLWRK